MRIWGWLYRWRWFVVAAWAVVAIAGGVIGGGIYDRTQTIDQLGPSAPSMRADDRLQQLIPEGPVVFAIVSDVDPYAPAVVESTQAVTSELAKWPSVKEVGDLYSAPGGRIGADTRSTLVRVEMRPQPSAADVSAVVAKLHSISAPRVLVGGQPVAEADFASQAISDAALGESIALVALALLLIVITRWGAIAPLAAAAAAVTTTLLVLVGLASVMPVSEYAVNVVTLLGLGLAVDYALLLLWRFREELARSSPEEALAQTMRTAGKAVVVSGAIVAAAMAGLAIFAEPLLAAMALGGAVVVVVATVVALTLTPALLGLLAPRLRPFPAAAFPATAFPAAAASAAGSRAAGSRVGGSSVGSRSAGSRVGGSSAGSRVAGSSGAGAKPGLLDRLTAIAQRRPDTVIIVAVVALILMALPLTSVNLINSDARALPASVESRTAYDVYFRDFQHSRPDPVTVVVDTGSGGEAMRDYLDKLNHLTGVAKLELRFGTPPEATIVDLTPTSEPAGVDLARSVRALPAPAAVLVGGPGAELADYRDSVAGRLPIAVLVLVVAIGLLLFLLTRSVLIPVKALVMNAMTLVAALGVLTVVFGWKLDVTTPILLFVFIFGLSTDYEVFLLSRITEGHRAGLPTDRAVREGIARTGAVVTTAAAGLIVVFLGFVLGGLTPVREIGVGMAVAIALDVTVLRGLLLPATMTLLGRWNWWPS